MRGKVKLSPAARGRVDLENRIELLEEYEAWAKCQRLDIERLVDPDKWKEYYALQDEILSRMRAAQNIADLLRKQILIASEMSEVAQ